MSQFVKILIFSHIFAGGVSLLMGILAIILPKTTQVHKKIGIVYFYSMLWIFISSVLMLIFHYFNSFLMVIAIFSFYLSFSGYRVMKRKRLGEQTWVDWTGAVVTLIAGVGLFLYGVIGYFTSWLDIPYQLSILCVLFGIFTGNAARTDIVTFLKKDIDDKMWWMYHHISAMMGSFIAAITAFAVNNAGRLMPYEEYRWLLWLLPTAILLPLITIWSRNIRNNNEQSKLNRKVRRKVQA